MELSVAFLGTGGAVPSARRNTASVLVARGGERLLFDCGEGTQRQMQRSVGLVQVDEIYLTHYHADHFLGLPGLLKTYDLTEREAPLTVYGPPGLRALFTDFDRLVGRVSYRLDLVELEPDDAIEIEGGEITPFAVEHSARAYGYAVRDYERPGRFDPDAARALGVREGPAFAALQRGESVEGADGPVAPSQVMGEARPGRKVVFTGDTRPCPATIEAARGAELLVHDASFAAEEAPRAADTGHSTVTQAAEVGLKADVRMLALVHISSRYHVGKVLEEAREIFPTAIAPRDFDLIEVPYPDRGEPTLIPNGARERRGDDEQHKPPTSSSGATEQHQPQANSGSGRSGDRGASPEPPPGTAE